MHLSFFIRDITLRKETEELSRPATTHCRTPAADCRGGRGHSGWRVNQSMMALTGVGGRGLCVQFSAVSEGRGAGGGRGGARRPGRPGAGIGNEAQGRHAVLRPGLAGAQPESGRRHDRHDFAVGRRSAAQQLELYAAQLRQKNAEMEADLRMARDLQYAFLPSPIPPSRAIPLARPPALRMSTTPAAWWVATSLTSFHLPGQVLVFVADEGHGAGRAGGGDDSRPARADRV